MFLLIYEHKLSQARPESEGGRSKYCTLTGLQNSTHHSSWRPVSRQKAGNHSIQDIGSKINGRGRGLKGRENQASK
ncbi:hypothetical protein E4U54_006751 [Claviceps lovelessii]|nr:hypothetical protein E4U54_006751 [Claviceps lovelessii]